MPPAIHDACERCLARTWLIGRLAGHLEQVRAHIEELLALDDETLMSAVGGKQARSIGRELHRLDLSQLAKPDRLEVVCRCSPQYPDRLRSLAAPPAVLYVAGGIERVARMVGGETLAVVGARRASPYGTDVARKLGRTAALAEIPVISGMALGIDSAAHAGALEGSGCTVAVLPGGLNRPYPAAKRGLYRAIVQRGAALSELPPDIIPRGWMFAARNRLIAALSSMTVVVEAGPRSGALITARLAAALGQPVGAVPGRVTSPTAVGTNELIARGAQLVRGLQDVLEVLYGPDAEAVREEARRSRLEPSEELLLEALASGESTLGAIARAGLSVQDGLATVASLELSGYLRREPGGRFAPTT